MLPKILQKQIFWFRAAKIDALKIDPKSLYVTSIHLSLI